jgi:hypothetical protein
MALQLNIRHLEEHGLHLEGELSLSELDITLHDEVIQLTQPLEYKLEVQKLEGGPGSGSSACPKANVFVA